MTHESAENDGKLRYFFVFAKADESFSVVIDYQSIRLTLGARDDDYLDDLEQVIEWLPRLIGAAKQERDVRIALSEMDDDLDRLFTEEGEV